MPLPHCSQPLPDPSTLLHLLPGPVWRLIEELTAKDPACRLPDARSLRLAAELLLRP